ncbi:MAG: ATP-binding protein [Bacillota bacterium]
MLQLMIMLMIAVVLAISILGGYNRNKYLVLMNTSFIGMLFCLLCYFIKVGGAFPQKALILYGLSWVLSWINGIAIGLNTLGFLENFFRFAVVYFLLLHSMDKNISVKNALKNHKYVYVLTSVPILIILYFSNPALLYGKFAYNYAFQNFIVNASWVVVRAYLVASFVLLIVEYRLIALSWYKKPHLANIVQLGLFAVPYIIFAQIDPVVIYQDYLRICVFSDSILLTAGSSLGVWIWVLVICILSLISMIVQCYIFLKFEYDRDKLEISITQKVTSAEVTASMLLHGLKNQLLSANILARKLAKGMESEDIEKAQLIETSRKLLEINNEMSAKLSYLYKTVDSVKVSMKHVSTEELLASLKAKVKLKDVDNIVSYTSSSGVINADVELLSEAICNIISNAIEAVKDVQSRKMVVVRIAYTRNHALVTIADNGCGMDEATKGKIFMPFTSSKNSTTNWGLGLCYSRRIIKQHHGDIRFDSTKGKGTMFYITLPIHSEE